MLAGGRGPASQVSRAFLARPVAALLVAPTRVLFARGIVGRTRELLDQRRTLLAVGAALPSDIALILT